MRKNHLKKTSEKRRGNWRQREKLSELFQTTASQTL